MEPMSGDQGLESDRVTVPSNEDQSTAVDSDNAWTVTLQKEPLANRQENPQIIVSFEKDVDVHAMLLQGSSDKVEKVTFILSAWDEDSLEFKDYLDPSGKPKVSGYGICPWPMILASAKSVLSSNGHWYWL